MKNLKLILIVISSLCAFLIDFLFATATFLSFAHLGELLMVAALALCFAGLAMRMRWPVLVAQNGLILLSVAHAWRGIRPDLIDWVYLAGFILLGNLLVWPIALLAKRRELVKG